MNELIKSYADLVQNAKGVSMSFSESDFAQKIHSKYQVIIVLDDDPTGTQTVHDIPVLTDWSIQTIADELDRGTLLFFILTNTRSLPPESARKLNQEILDNIKSCLDTRDINCLLVSRSDSTLRGHFPMETDMLLHTFKPDHGVVFLAPAFFEGGRYTIDNIHYVREEEQLIPAAHTPFARDKVFGFKASNLREWIVEKSGGRIKDEKIHSITLMELENDPTDKLTSKINHFKPGDICIINATQYDHLKKAIYCIMSGNIDPIFRSAASLVAALVQQTSAKVDIGKLSLNEARGGLTVVGSYVPRSSRQLKHVMEHTDACFIKIDVAEVVEGRDHSLEQLVEQIDENIFNGQNVVIYTSRTLIAGSDSAENLRIGMEVSKFLTDLVSSLKVIPKYIIGKGGITSSDLATKSLRIRRAWVLGQVIAGVPMWQSGEESQFPGIPFVVFPGNVGSDADLMRVIMKMESES